MPNAAAGLDVDYGLQAAPRRSHPRAAPRVKGRGSRKGGRFHKGLFSRMPRYGAIAISTLIGVGIVVNALMMQHGHHPAPLFGGIALDRTGSTKVADKPVPAPPEVAAASAPSNGVAPSAKPAADQRLPDASARPATRPKPTKAAQGEDAIALLLAGQTAAPPRKTKPVPEKASTGRATQAKPDQKHRKQVD